MLKLADRALRPPGPSAVNTKDVVKRNVLHYTTGQTIVYRLEKKEAVRRVRKIGNAHIFEAVVKPEEARGRFADELLSLVGGSVQPLMAYFIKKKKVAPEDLEYMNDALKLRRTKFPAKVERKKPSA